MPPFFNPFAIALSQFNGTYSWGGLAFFLAIGVASCFFYLRPNQTTENYLFWLFGLLLIVFTVFRPLGLGRDDLAYIEISKTICPFSECLKFIQSSRDFAWYGLVGLIKSLLNGPRALLLLAAFGLLIQLYVINRLCRQKLLALTFFIPHIYLLFDLTILRAGLALSFYFLAIYFLIVGRKIFGGLLLGSNFLFHSQGIFSIGLWPFYWPSKYRWVCLVIGMLCLLGIYLQFTFTPIQLSFLAKAESAPYLNVALNGGYIKEKAFSFTSLLLLFYLLVIFIFEKKSLNPSPVNQYVLASVLLGLVLAWIFAPIMTMQSRLFDFYIAPLVFLVGNLKPNKWAFWGTIALSMLLYVRLEFLHNFILG